MSLYRHFAGKTELVAESLRARDPGHVDWLLPSTWEPGCERAHILAMFDRIGQAARRPGFHGCPFLAVAGELPVDDPAQQAVREHKRRLGARIRTVLRAMQVSDAARLSRQAVVPVDGASQGCLVIRGSAAARTAREIAALLLDRSEPAAGAG